MILIEKKKEKTWLSVQSSPFTDEAELQSLLLSNPELFPLMQFGLAEKPVRFFVKEVELEAGYVDLLGFSEDGTVTIVECKLARNDEARREVVGQLLDYASDLYQWSYEELQEVCAGQEISGGHLDGDLAKMVCERAKDSELDGGIVRNKISKNLRDGTFRLVVVVEGLRPSLKRIVSYIGRPGSSGINLCLLELRQYSQEEGRIIVPILHGGQSIDQEPPTVDDVKLEAWREILRKTRERIGDSLPHNMNWFPPKAAVGKSYNGYYIEADPAKKDQGKSVYLWAEPEGLKLLAVVYSQDLALIGPPLKEITGNESDSDDGEVYSVVASWAQIGEMGDAQLVEKLTPLFLRLCEKFGNPAFRE